ncbi:MULTISPECIES: DUF6510 family protein [Micromonospora]|uniref:Hydrogenase maturation nickel metallochaperone HypA n=1 Tax=Micromonospora sicca TaxID=2202420 RepID=A0A317D2J3_9ACTN|nr:MULTISPECIES: DUF6510 family protein [unclassified Micromonospora]MBM0227399.1 hypothetical protein [Micromonospora sp. ATA51]PWR08410.1 hypothetical protein DKT69_32835 [Micromonospora sp. 4G51]
MTDMSYLDGNMLDGPLRELFAVDLSSATGRCESCGRLGPVAGLHVFSHAPGLVARCPACGGVMLRLVRAPDRVWLDLRGTTFLQVPMPLDQPHPRPL